MSTPVSARRRGPSWACWIAAPRMRGCTASITSCGGAHPSPRPVKGTVRRSRDSQILAEREFRESRGDWSVRSPHEADITAVLRAGPLGHEFRSLCCARSAFSFLDQKARESGGPLPSDVYWLARPLLDVLAVDDAVIASAGALYSRTGPGARHETGRHLSFW